MASGDNTVSSRTASFFIGEFMTTTLTGDLKLDCAIMFVGVAHPARIVARKAIKNYWGTRIFHCLEVQLFAVFMSY